MSEADKDGRIAQIVADMHACLSMDLNESIAEATEAFQTLMSEETVMTDQTEAAEVEALVELLTIIRADRDGNRAPRDYYRRWSEVEADAILASDWLATDRAAAEARGNVAAYKYVHRLLGDATHEVIEEHVEAALAAAEARGAERVLAAVERAAEYRNAREYGEEGTTFSNGAKRLSRTVLAAARAAVVEEMR